MHIAEIDLTAPGIGFQFTPPGGPLETVRQTTLDYLNQQHAQLAINGEFFLLFPSSDPNAMLVGFAASNGNVYSSFEAPVQSYAIVTNAPAVNVDPAGRETIPTTTRGTNSPTPAPRSAFRRTEKLLSCLLSTMPAEAEV